MTNYTWPAGLTPSSSTMELGANTAVFQNPLTGTMRTLSRPGSRWRQALSFNALTGDDRATLQAFLAKLDGMANRVYLPDFAYTRRGAGGGTPLVNGASQTGTSLITDGWPNSTTVLKAGDYFEVNGEFKMVLADVTSDGSGNATITFSPNLRASPANDAPLDVDTPVALYVLTDPRVSWTNEPGIFSGFTIDFVEFF